MSLRTFFLRIISITYLLVPNIIFLISWIKPVFSVVLVLIILSFFVYIIESEKKRINADSNTNVKFPWILLVISLLSCVLFGIGEFREQTVDWGTNNFKIYDLVTLDWPTYYPKFSSYSCYYWAYYLPTAFLGKLVGIEYCRYFILIWSWIGISLIYLLLFEYKKSIKFVLLFVLFNNANIILLIIDLLNIPYFEHFIKYANVHLSDFNLAFWSPMVCSLQWVPQHLIPAGIVTLFLINPTGQRDYKADLFMYLCAILWSPLICIGLIPVILPKLWVNRNAINPFKSFPTYLLMILPFIPIALYLTANNAINTSGINDFIWNASPYWFDGYVVFLLINLGVWFWLLKEQLLSKNPYLIASLAAFAIFPLYRMGLFNDLLYRGIIPASFCLGIAILDGIERLIGTHQRKYYVGIALLLFLSVPSWIRLYEGCLPSQPFTTIEHPFTKNSKNTFDYLNEFYGANTIDQYKLREDSIFEKYFLNK